MDRPAVERLLADVKDGKVDCVVVYKVDRLSRSLMDFARMMETFEKRRVSFVSVTQHFNTTSSMGRLTLNILLSFAQFEREIIGERIRDKKAATARKGKWGGGMPVLGYDVDRSGAIGTMTMTAGVPNSLTGQTVAGSVDVDFDLPD
jgi:site-specific DNA recombinase